MASGALPPAFPAVRIDGDGYTLTRERQGDNAGVLLDYVGYDLADLRRAYRDKIHAANLTPGESAAFEASLEAGLNAYTYLAEVD